MIRKAKFSDLPEILRLYGQLRSGMTLVKKVLARPDEKSQKAMKNVLASKSTHLLVATEGKRIVGTCVAFVLPRVYLQGKNLGILDSIVVDENIRGKGVGSKLIRTAVEICRKAGCGQVNLTSNTQRTRAQDRKSTRLNSSHQIISYAVFCLKKKKTE